VHTPHIAGRTRDANWRVADVIADDFARILRGDAPLAALTPEAMRVRTEAMPVPGADAPWERIRDLIYEGRGA
jgi:hypothetical protein